MTPLWAPRMYAKDGLVKKALTLRASSIGDCLMGKYFLENVHAATPSARCTLLVGSRAAMINDLLQGYPWLDVIEVNRRHPLELLRSWRRLYGQDITLTQYAERPFSLPSKLFARTVTKRGGMVGFIDPFFANKILYDTLLPFAGEKKSEGMIVEEQKALAAAHIPISIKDFSLKYQTDSAVLARFGLEPKQYVVIHLFAGNEGRSISQEKRQRVVRAVRESLPAGYQVVLTGVSGEAARAEGARADMQGVKNLAGKTTVQELINLIAGARAVLALDSGAAHIAAHLKVPLVVLTRTEAKQGWWSEAMYGGRPTVLTQAGEDDEAPRTTPHPPSLEQIDLSAITATVARLI